MEKKTLAIGGGGVFHLGQRFSPRLERDSATFCPSILFHVLREKTRNGLLVSTNDIETLVNFVPKWSKWHLSKVVKQTFGFPVRKKNKMSTQESPHQIKARIRRRIYSPWHRGTNGIFFFLSFSLSGSSWTQLLTARRGGRPPISNVGALSRLGSGSLSFPFPSLSPQDDFLGRGGTLGGGGARLLGFGG